PAERRQLPMRAFPPEILAAAISTHEPHRMASKRPPSGTQTRCKHKKTSRLWTETNLECREGADCAWHRRSTTLDNISLCTLDAVEMPQVSDEIKTQNWNIVS
ncbi:hypothetical protein, partial [Rhizobium tibeticum]